MTNLVSLRKLLILNDLITNYLLYVYCVIKSSYSFSFTGCISGKCKCSKSDVIGVTDVIMLINQLVMNDTWCH